MPVSPEEGKAMELNALRDLATELGNPCEDCECCVKWGIAMELATAAMRAHVAGELRVAPCSADCLVCILAGKTPGRLERDS
jgi:hypothetical protein